MGVILRKSAMKQRFSWSVSRGEGACTGAILPPQALRPQSALFAKSILGKKPQVAVYLPWAWALQGGRYV
ncbi:hypothetical protein [Meiothermus cerbereus]|uniref:hypothetical protein n=1 Tax=Meiothermus cerbereus TaxID=65552 RepID=UPI003EE8B2AE